MPLIIPSPGTTKRLRRIQENLAASKETPNSAKIAAAATACLEDQEFQPNFIAGRKGKPIETTADLMDVCWAYLYFHLNRRDYVAAAMMLWSKEVFTPEPHCMQLVWDALFKERMISIIGAGGEGKTYGPSAWFLLDWVLDPEWTRIQLSSNTEDHLKKNLYADMVRLHSEASMVLPGTADAESISLDKKKGMGIFLLTIPGGPMSKGKIKGVHTKPRPYHPLFGRRSRTRALIDEAQEVAQNIYAEIPNRFSTAMTDDVEHIKFVTTANPKDPYSPFGQNCKPPGGFESVTLAQETWRSEKGWWVVSLNAMVHENVIARRVIYPGFVTYEGVKVWLKACNGDENHPDMYTYVYGKFPPQGTMRAIVARKHLERCSREWIFDGPTQTFGFSDYAFTGDLPTFSPARSGRAIGYYDQAGVRHDLPTPAMKIQVDLVSIMPRGDSQDLADEVLARCKQLSIKPYQFGDDRTGVGQGAHDIVRRQWKQKVGPFDPDEILRLENGDSLEGFIDTSVPDAAPIYGIHFGQTATSSKVAEEDTQLPVDQYEGIRSEVWYVFARLCELDVIGLGKGVDPKTIDELASRQGGRPTGKGKKLTVESKEIYKSRTGNPSPDRADAVTGVVHLARIITPNLLPKAPDTVSPDVPPSNPDFQGGMEEWGSVDMQGMDELKPINNAD
jgi:hypothetical protein